MRVPVVPAYLLIICASALPAREAHVDAHLSSAGQQFEELRQRLASDSGTEHVASNRGDVRLIKDQRSEARVRGFTLIQDEPESAWGTARAFRIVVPTP